jgi:hypothetical protein
MGVIYLLCPLDAEVRASLSIYGVSDEGWPDGRNPRLTEVRAVLDRMTGTRAEYQEAPKRGQPWGISVEDSTDPENGPWTELRTLKYDEDQPTDFYFEKGWPELIVRIVSRLAATCGTLCIFPDTGEPPVIVPAGADPDHLLASWERTSQFWGEESEDQP